MSKIKTIRNFLFVFVIIFSLSIYLYNSATAYYDDSMAYKSFYDNTGNQTQLNISSYNEFMYYDSIMNVKYKFLIKDLDSVYNENRNTDTIFSNSIKQYKNTIIGNHKLWITVRKSNAEAVAFLSEGGTIYHTIYLNQKTQDTKARIEFYEFLRYGNK